MPLKNQTYKITEKQIEWLAAQSEKTGLAIVELVRRALDVYAETETDKEHRQLFTPEQRREIKTIARKKGITEREVVREAIDRETRRSGY